VHRPRRTFELPLVVAPAGTGSIAVKANFWLSGDHAYCVTDSSAAVNGHASPPLLRITHTCAFASWPFCFPRDDTKLM
jgi:hypothetical protein